MTKNLFFFYFKGQFDLFRRQKLSRFIFVFLCSFNANSQLRVFE